MLASLDTAALLAVTVPTLAATGLTALAGAGWHQVAKLRAQLATAHTAATHDRLTGLANRAGLVEAWERLVDEQRPAVLLIDLDGFKPVNDQHGHAAGDQVLTTIAARLRHLPGVVARLGGDEFAALTGNRDPAAVARHAAKLVARPITLTNGAQVTVAASIGVAPDPGLDLSVALGCADAAMYRAKHTSTSVAVYDPYRDDHPSPAGDPRPITRVRALPAQRVASEVAA